MRLEGKQVEIEGVFERFDFSETRSLMYLIFANDSNWNSARGLVEVADAPAELSEEALKPLIGKKIRMRGTVEIQTSFNLTRPLLKLDDPASIIMAE